MDNNFARVKSMIQRLRDVLKCQKCYQLKKEDSMVFYRVCDHFYCTDCVGDNKSCPLCDNPFNKSTKVLEDKNMFSLYQSLVNFELPSKENVKRICENHKQSKLKVLNNNNEKENVCQKEVQETPKSAVRSKRMCMKGESGQKEIRQNHSGENKESLGVSNDTPKSRSLMRGDPVPSTSGKANRTTTPIQRERNFPRTSTPATRGRTTTPDTSLRKMNNTTPLNTSGNSKANTSSSSKLNINKRNPKGETKLHLACKKSNFKEMAELIAAGANPNAQDNAGWSPLHDSVFSGNIKVIKFLLDNGAKVNLRGLENTTALHEAIAKGNIEMVKLLLEYGADTKAMNIFRETPLDLVTKYKLEDLKGILEKADDCKKTLSEDSAEEPDENIVIYKHDLPIEDEKSVNKFAEKFNLQMVTSMTWKTPASHIFVPGTKFTATWSLISSVLSGCCVVTVDWAKDCIKEEVLKPSSLYELSDPTFSGFRKARANKHNQLPGLFSGCHFFFGGSFESYTIKSLVIGKEDLKSLVEKNGGVTLKRCPDPESLALEKTVPFHADSASSLKETSYFIIYQTEKWDPRPKYNMSHMKTLPIDWLVCCIFKFELIDPKSGDFSCDHFL